MAQTNVYLNGTVKWFKMLGEPEEFQGKSSWSMDFYPDAKSFEIIKEHKLDKFPRKVREDEDGKFIKLRRPSMKPWKLKPGESPEFDPVHVIDVNDEEWDRETLIGNGSHITVKLAVYPTAGTPGARVDVVRVNKHVQYNKDDKMPAYVADNVPLTEDKESVQTDRLIVPASDIGMPF